MDANELRRRRKAAGLTQAQLARKLGLHRDFVGLMERGKQPIAERTALVVSALLPDPVPPAAGSPPPLRTTDPMERIIEGALLQAGIKFRIDRDGAIPEHLDFYLPGVDVFIEVKRMHSPRSINQLARAENVILAQGVEGVRFLAKVIEAGGLSATRMAVADPD